MVKVFAGHELGIIVDPMQFLNEQVVIRTIVDGETLQMKCRAILSISGGLAGPDTEGYERFIPFNDIAQIELL